MDEDNNLTHEEMEAKYPGMIIKKCEIFSRVVGYLRPVSNWHKSKQQEFKDRVVYGYKNQ